MIPAVLCIKPDIILQQRRQGKDNAALSERGKNHRERIDCDRSLSGLKVD